MLVAGPVRADPVPCEQEIELARRFADVKTMRADFRDEKRIVLMEEPLVSQGRILYLRPDRIRQDIERPSRQTLVIAGNRMSIRQHDLGKEQRFDVDSNPMMKAIVQNILLVLSGQVDRMVGQYRCLLTRDDEAYHLELTPLKEPMSKVMKSIRVAIGRDMKMREVVMEEAGGDVSRLTFTNVVHDQPFTDEEVKRHFTP